ncbi:AAA family ATPase [Candidatus Saganbacteria bacterium]|nr:AAA family ATPase [Candidatus Saganbacteria bacterium]
MISFQAPGYAQSADDHYDRAVNKYFLGDNEGALKDLGEALKLDPNHTRAMELQNEIKKEMGPAAPPPPPPKVQEKPAFPSLRQVLPPTLPKPKKEEPQKEEPRAPLFRPQKPPAATAVTANLIQQISLWMGVVSVLTLLLLIRITYTNIRDYLEKKKLQICTECKWSNPGAAEFCAKCGARLKPWTGVTAAQRKWYAKFGWKRNPFTLDILPNLFTGYQTQVQNILEKICLKSGHVLVCGNKGVGKTTLLKWLADKLKDDYHTIYIPRPTDNFDDLLEFLAASLKLKKPKDRRFTIYDLESLASTTQKNILLFLDEAHEFSAEFERPLRTLGDLNGVNFVLAGLLETSDKIKCVSAPFYDRIILEVTLEHLSVKETEEMMQKRIENSGGTGLKPFTPESVENIYKMSQGVPRMILKVCDWVITDAIRHDLNVIGETAGEGYNVVEGEKKT